MNEVTDRRLLLILAALEIAIQGEPAEVTVEFPDDLCVPGPADILPGGIIERKKVPLGRTISFSAAEVERLKKIKQGRGKGTGTKWISQLPESGPIPLGKDERRKVIFLEKKPEEESDER